MAMQEGTPVPAHSAQVVGNAFVEQYYHVLHSSPAVVYRFYQESSLLSRPDSDGIMKTVTSMQAIDEMITSLNYEDYKAEIETADAQDSYEKGVIVLVTGFLTGKDNVQKKFAQTFFLAPQDKGYYVRNDVLRFAEEKKIVEVSSGMENGNKENAPIAPLTPDTEEPAHVPDHHQLDSVAPLKEETEEAEEAEDEEEDLDNVAEVYDPSDNEGSVIEEEVVEPSIPSNQNETIPVSEVAPVAQEDAPKKSYASILKAMRSSAPSTPAHVLTSSVRPVSTTSDRPLFVSAKPAPQTDAVAPIIESAPENNNVNEEAEGYSVYVRNLPTNATVEQVAEAFNKFGHIKRDGIQVRSNKGFCFGFVEFESLTSMQSALEASPILLGDRQVDVEEKRTTTRVGGGGRGRYNSARGGFRNDNFRGRGNFGGGRGYGRNEYRNQAGDFSGRPRGGQTGRNEEGYQRVNHNGFGQGGGRQGGTNQTSSPA